MSQYKIYTERRDNLVKNIKQKYKSNKNLILLFASFENDKYRFNQDSTFYYFTSLKDPALVFSIENADNSKKDTVYLPNYKDREKWVKSDISINSSEKDLRSMEIDKVEVLGDYIKSYNLDLIFNKDYYENLINLLKKYKDFNIFTTYSKNYPEQYLLIKQIISILPEIEKNIIDISDIIAQMRREKSLYESELIYTAVNYTMAAHEMAGSLIKESEYEFEVQAGIDFVFAQNGAQPAFPSIVASGENGLTLHYNSNSDQIKKDSLVIVDIGAKLDYYCADISRTYPASGKFSKLQKEIYQIVLDTQEYIHALIKPGYFLNNKNEPDKSLHHLAVKFLDRYGYAKYFNHSIGHYLGLDVHDVGSYLEPLKESDVFTIEPGIYIPEKNIAIRIEDDYLITSDEIVCLSEDLSKNPEDIEELMSKDYEFNMNFQQFED